jgi:putative NADPH-quinone reductase
LILNNFDTIKYDNPMKNILIINAHPDQESFCKALAESYLKGAEAGNHTCKLVNLNELQFNINLPQGYRVPTPLEPDLIEVQKMISDANHIVFVYPNWWGTFPALLKGFIDRVFIPGFAFKYRENSSLWDKLLVGKTAHLIITMDSPYWYYRWLVNRPGINAMKKCILGFCGIKTVKTSIFSPVRPSPESKRKQWLNSVFEDGKSGK